MAEVNMAQALYSPTYAKKCWINYYYQGNSMNISATEIGQIEATWHKEVKDWKTTATRDENKYEIVDDDIDKAKDTGKKKAKSATGYKNSAGDKTARGVKHSVSLLGAGASVLGAVASLTSKCIGKAAIGNAIKETAKAVGRTGAKKIAGKTVGKLAEKQFEKFASEGVKEATKDASKTALEEATKKTTEETSKKVAETASEEVAKDAGKSVGCIIGCTMALATGVLYQAMGPNRKEHKALVEAEGELANAQNETATAQGEMETMNAELVAAADEAEAINEDANTKIEETKTQYDFYKTTYMTLKAKVDSGVALTSDEKDLYKSITKQMTEAGVVIDETSADASEQVTTVHDNMAEYQEGFDTAAETIASVDGFTQEIAGYDKSTEIMCYVEAASQGINVASGTVSASEALALATSGAWACGATAWAYAVAAVGFAGVAMSGAGVAEQIKYASDIHNEIDIREATQDLNATTAEAYDMHIEDYASYMEGVEGLELEIPDDIEAPEETTVPVTADSSTANANEKKKPKETA